MKLFASRVEYDADDIALPYGQLGFSTVEQGLDVFAAAYPTRPIPPKSSICSKRSSRRCPQPTRAKAARKLSARSVGCP